MLRALDDLERAVERLLKQYKGQSQTRPGSDAAGEGGTAARMGETAPQPYKTQEDAAELIRRALKRLKSL